MDWSEIGSRIRQQREYLGYTREELAELVDITPKFVADIELAIKGFSVPTLCRICHTLHLSADYVLFGETGEERSDSCSRLLNGCSVTERAYAEQLLKTMRKTKSHLTCVDTRNMTRGEWLERRRKTIGGSDAAGIVNLSAYASAYSVWAEKTGRLPDKEDNEAMRQGRDLEEYVAKRWEEETGKKVQRKNAMIYNSDYPFAHADIDRAVVGESAGLECKTSSALDVRQFHGVDFPAKYYCQCIHYLAVTGYARWYLAVLVFGKGFYTFVLERDEDEINALMAAEREFWKLVETDTPPALDGQQPTADALAALYPTSTDSRIDLTGRERQLQKYLELKEQKKSLDEQLTAIENTIKGDLMDAEIGHCGDYSVTWKTQIRKLFQPQEFSKAHPEIDLAPYYKSSSSRPFKVATLTG